MSQLENLQQQLLDVPLIQSAQQWFQGLSGRDQKIVKLLALFVVLALIFSLVFAPLMKRQSQAESALARSLATYNEIAENAHHFGSRQAAGGPVLARVTRQARADGIRLSRYEQDGQGLRIWLDRVAFDEAIRWLENLKNSQGIRVSQINIDRKDRPGWVDIRATLTP